MKLTPTIEINAPASEVWELFGDKFADVSEWADSITKSTLDGPLEEGAKRTCDIKGFGPVAAGQVREELTHFDRKSYSLTYLVFAGVPSFMKSIENAWRIEAIDEKRCLVTSEATFVFKWWAIPAIPLMRVPLQRGIKDFTQQLSDHVVTDGRKEIESLEGLLPTG